MIVSSSVHYWTDIGEPVYDAESSWEVLNTAPKLKSEIRYPERKLLNVFFTLSLADLLKDTPVIVTTLNPGYCLSELRRSCTSVQAIIDYNMEKLLAW